MSDYSRPEEAGPSPDAQNDSFVFHPYNVYLTLLLFSLTMMFLTLTGAFVYSRIQSELPPLRLPWLFLVNTAILLGSSYTLIRAKRAYREDDTEGYQRLLWYTLGLSILFLISQCFAWYQLFNEQIYIYSDNSSGYLYVISILHFLHVIAGLPFLGMFLYRARTAMQEPVSVLVYFSDPEKRLKLRLLTLYWHFLDGLWIYLVLFFFVYRLIFDWGMMG